MNLRQLEQLSPGTWFYDVNDQLKNHIYRRQERAFAAGDAARDAIQTCEQLMERARAVREFFLRGIGGLPSMGTPLNAHTVGTVEGNGFKVERVIFESRPYNYVTANLYLPEDLTGPRGAVLFLCGHHREGKHAEEYQIVCQYLVQAGLVVFAQDPIGQGERFSYYEPSIKDVTIGVCTLEHDYAGAQCLPLGENIARYFLHDAMRSIDYMCTRPEIDPNRIGVTGNSGGGTQSCLVMMGDPRIAAAAPGTFVMNRETYMWAGGAQDAEQIWHGFTAAGFDHEDVLIAMVPKPVRVLAVTGDFFPIEGTRRTVQRCKRLWELFGKGDNIDLVEDHATHAYTPHLARAAASFFAKHLLGKEVHFEEERITAMERSRLWCTVSGQVRGELENASSVHEAIQVRLQELEQQRYSLPESQRRERAIEWLREKVLRNRERCDLNPRYYSSTRMEELCVTAAMWRSQPDLFGHGLAFRHIDQGDNKLPVTLAVWDGGTNRLRPHIDWIRRTCENGRNVLVLDVSGVGALAPRPITAADPEEFYGVLHKLSTDLLWLDDDMAALRTYDVLRALDMIAEWPGMDEYVIDLYADGRHGLYGRLAALLDSRIDRVEIAGGITSYQEWVVPRYYDSRDIYSVILRGVLQYFDLPELEVTRNR